MGRGAYCLRAKEAAGFLNPMGEGISSSLESGRAAAMVALEVLDGFLTPGGAGHSIRASCCTDTRVHGSSVAVHRAHFKFLYGNEINVLSISSITTGRRPAMQTCACLLLLPDFVAYRQIGTKVLVGDAPNPIDRLHSEAAARPADA